MAPIVSNPSTSQQQPVVWALLGAHAGDNDQVLAVAKLLGLPFVTKQLRYNRLRWLGPRVLGASFASLDPECRRRLVGKHPPELTISAGHRSVPVVQALRALSGGGTRSIHIGFPRVSAANFDLVITTPQYPVADHPNLLRLPFALTTAAFAQRQEIGPELAALPAPRQLVIVGGPTLYWNIDEVAVRAALETMLDSAGSHGGSVVVSTSPRTPHALRELIAAQLSRSKVPTMLATPGSEPSLASLLNAAAEVRVTADSVAMISDAIWSGKPVAIVPVKESLTGKIAYAALPRGRRLYPRDLRSFWRALQQLGIGEEPSLPQVSSEQVKTLVQERLKPIAERLRSSAALY